MAWARLDDRFHEHWKVAEAGLEAVGLWTLCLTWANQARRTSPTPGVVPESVVLRFAGSPAKGKRLAAKLHKVGMFDDRTDAGWPIHDFSVYLAKYDPQQAAQNGRKGGEAKAAAKQTASKPLAESAANRVATSSTQASVRRNPVPVPSEPKGSGRQRPPTDDDPNPTAQQLVAAYVDLHTRRPPSNVIGQVARQVGALLGEDFEPELIRTGLKELVRKRLNPSTLPSLVNELANAAPDLAEVPSVRQDIPPWENFG